MAKMPHHVEMFRRACTAGLLSLRDRSALGLEVGNRGLEGFHFIIGDRGRRYGQIGAMLNGVLLTPRGSSTEWPFERATLTVWPGWPAYPRGWPPAGPRDHVTATIRELEQWEPIPLPGGSPVWPTQVLSGISQRIVSAAMALLLAEDFARRAAGRESS